jgi:heme-degrading monooxygenase HmoA
MFVLQVDIRVRAERAGALEAVFAGPFSAAIRAQEGFRDVRLLRPLEGGDYVLSIAFEQQALQQKWVATDLHARVWSQMEEHIDGYALKPYSAV